MHDKGSRAVAIDKVQRGLAESTGDHEVALRWEELQKRESIRRKCGYIRALKVGPISVVASERLKFLERMRLEDMEKGTRLLLMMKETEFYRSCDDVIGSIAMLRHIQLDDADNASRLLSLARETQRKVDEKTDFITRIRERLPGTAL
ncbi:hypothetical protein Tco_0157493 [Tanacetum coccineum]